MSTDLVASIAIVYLAPVDGQFPAHAYESLMRIANREEDVLKLMFPRDPIDRVKQLVRGANVARDYYRLGLEVHFSAGRGFDVEAYVDSLIESEDIYIEARIQKISKSENHSETQPRHTDVFIAGKQRVSSLDAYRWRMMFCRPEFARWVQEHHDRDLRFLAGRHVVVTGAVRKMSRKRIIESVKAQGGVLQELVDDETGILVVGHEPDKVVVDDALEQGVALMNETFFGLLVDTSDDLHWEASDFRVKRPPHEARKRVIEVFEQFELKYEALNLPEGDSLTSVSDALLSLADQYLVFQYYGETIGAWKTGKFHEEFSHIIDRVISISEGRVAIQNYVVTNEHDGLDEDQGTISISFEHDGQRYEWHFEANGDNRLLNYLEEVSSWAKSALGPGYYEDSADGIRIWYLNPLALKALNKLFAN